MKKAYIKPVVSVLKMQNEVSICTASLGADSVPIANHGKADRVDDCSADVKIRFEWGNLWGDSLME